MNYNYNFSNALVIHTSLQPLSIQILPTQHYITLTNQVCQIGLIRINICPNPSTMNKNRTIITTLQRGYNSPESYYQQPFQQTTSYNPYQDQPIEEKSSLEKTFEVFLESIRQVQIIADSVLPNNSQIQDPYSNFQVQP